MGRRLTHGYPDIPFQIFALQQMIGGNQKRTRPVSARDVHISV
jgi:hypothetical protein